MTCVGHCHVLPPKEGCFSRLGIWTSRFRKYFIYKKKLTMGQKVHPVGFRLGITQHHLSKWFAHKQNYSKYLCEDNFLRKKLQQQFENARLEKVEISRKIEDHLEMVIYAEKPEIIVGLKGKNLKNLQQDIKKTIEKYRQSRFFQTSWGSMSSLDSNKAVHPIQDNLQKKTKKQKSSQSNIRVTLHIMGCSNTNASSIANFLIELLERRFSYRFALNVLFRKKLHEKLQGIKIQISGRLNGAEIARREWVREGRLPLQTLQANIDYSYKQAYTIYGVLGVKVWVFQ